MWRYIVQERKPQLQRCGNFETLKASLMNPVKTSGYFTYIPPGLTLNILSSVDAVFMWVARISEKRQLPCTTLTGWFV
jgi:hypothetical protein